MREADSLSLAHLFRLMDAEVKTKESDKKANGMDKKADETLHPEENQLDNNADEIMDNEADKMMDDEADKLVEGEASEMDNEADKKNEEKKRQKEMPAPEKEAIGIAAAVIGAVIAIVAEANDLAGQEAQLTKYAEE